MKIYVRYFFDVEWCWISVRHTCGDLLFSGHTCAYTVLACVWTTYSMGEINKYLYSSSFEISIYFVQLMVCLFDLVTGEEWKSCLGKKKMFF
jgi:hypothetical protein